MYAPGKPDVKTSHKDKPCAGSLESRKSIWVFRAAVGCRKLVISACSRNRFTFGKSQ